MRLMAQLTEGEVVAGRFRVVSLIGQGGMGQVYEAEQLNLARKVALKVLRSDVGDIPGARARFKREAKVAAALHHRGAVQIHDFGEDQGRLFLAMELLEGSTLRQAIGSSPSQLLALDRIIAIVEQVAEVLVAAHTIGLVHRDLKPSNIFLTTSKDAEGTERVVVADFGLAFIQDRDDAGRMTKDGILSGTPAYISPEQALGRSLGPATDVYSLGCTLYELITGSPPFVDESEVAVVTKHLFSYPMPIRQAQPDSSLPPPPQALEDLMLQMLAKRPEERPSPDQVRAGLASIKERVGQGERSRGELQLLVREARMIPEPLPVLEGQTVEGKSSPAAALSLDVVRIALFRSSSPDIATSPASAETDDESVDELLERALAANGIELLRLRELDLPTDAAGIYAPEATPEELERLAERDLPLLTNADASDVARLAALVELGVDEVIPIPVKPEELARRALRAIKRYRGRKRGRGCMKGQR